MKIFVVRLVLGLVFGFMLVRFFLPGRGAGTSLAIAGLLVFFAYVLEAAHKGSKP